MAIISMQVTGFAVLFCLFLGVSGDGVKGSVQLNSGVFEKIVRKHKAVLVKFDETYPYGEKQDAFKAVAAATLSQMDILPAEVQVADYGEKENHDLAERFNVKKDHYPVYKLFLNGDVENPVTYKGNVKNEDDIKKFLMKESGLWLGLPACLEEFDKVVKDFYSASGEKRQDILKQAEGMTEKLTDEKKKSYAEIYVKTMKKILEKGDKFVDTEIERVEKLRDGKVSDKKKEQLGERLNILTSFQLSQKDEL